MSDPATWDGDRLGFADVSGAFTKLVQTIDDSKVISIEAGYGRGKTFFRQRWPGIYAPLARWSWNSMCDAPTTRAILS